MTLQAWEAIPGWSGDILPYYAELAASLPQGARVIEVGVLFGRSIACLGTLRPDIELWAVDTWADPVLDSPGAAFADVAREFGKTTWEAFWGLMHAHAPEVLGRLHVVRARSTEVVLPEAHVVFIDAAHDEANVRADIAHWRGRVVSGGELSGHDYQNEYPGVVAAVDAAFAGEVRKGPGDWSSVWRVSR